MVRRWPVPRHQPRGSYLGAVALDENGLGVRISSVRQGGPAQLRRTTNAHDLVVGAGGKRIQLLRELTAVLKRMNPGDRLVLDVMRGGRQMHVEVVLAAPPSVSNTAAPPTLPPPAGVGSGHREPIPPPPADLNVPAPAEGPALTVPQAPPPNGMQAQIDELHHRVEVLERRVQELERALADKQKK